MKIKDILPWNIESPVIQLVQPRPTLPLGHEVVFTQISPDGAGDNAFYTLAAQQKEARRQRKARQDRSEGEDTNLCCGYISPSPRVEASEEIKTRNSFYDLRSNRSMSIAVENPSEEMKLGLVLRSRSVEECRPLEARRKSPDFEEILKDLARESRIGSDGGDSTASKGSSISETSRQGTLEREIEEESFQNTDFGNSSVFYDVSLDDQEVEETNTLPKPEVPARKSFSEETFDRNKISLLKERSKVLERVSVKPRSISSDSCSGSNEDLWGKLSAADRRRVSQMVDDLLMEIYGEKSARPVRRRSCTGIMRQERSSSLKEDILYDSLYEDPYCTEYTTTSDPCRLNYLERKGVLELQEIRDTLHADVKRLGNRLAKQLIQRDCLLAKRDWHCDWITAYLQANSEKRSEDTKTRFSVTPSPGDSGFTQWQNGMRAVARLPEGIPPQFRKTLWLNLAEKHLASRGVQWQQVEESCFNEFTNPDDEELGVQIVKDVHRTGCSLFCGVSGKDNQALLKRVLLAYARWNKAVGYCQGFNMLAALILQVMDKSEVDSVKVMIYLIEGVLPESYFANSLRGLSVDMAVFRDLLRIKLPVLSKHFDQLQCGDSKDCGSSYEPPLTNVFTMQWFLTLFCNCLPQETVLRVWDLIFLEGNHVLLCTALAIWSTLADRILTVESADEFYCIMGVLTREMLEFGLMDANGLIKAIVSFSLPELAELREKYLYNITPWTQSVSTVAKRGLRLFYSDEDTDTEEDDEKIAIATAYGLFRSPKKKDGASGVTSPPRALTCPDKEKIAMDISALTKQYRKLRERQKQAHVILTAACGSQSLVGPTTSPAMNHLLMGKFALVNSRGRRLGPPPGSIPPPAQSRSHPGERQKIVISGETLHWKDTAGVKKTPPTDDEEEKSPDSSPSKHSSRRSSSSSSSTELCDDPQRLSDSEDLSDSLAPSLGSQPSTPLRSPRPKMRHPVDVESCKEEIEEITDSLLEANLKSDESSQPELEHKLKEDLFSINIDEEEDHSQQKRKPSFRIDPEELRQLDRKLSLKIVEIERRKSSAGIESEDLDSKVLFPFDRDYIQEGLKTNRGDTPTSIPDDRLCSMDDFSCDFEEETIPVPDLITTHKPFNHRMSSLEECDESKLNENVDATEVIKAESFDENESEFKSFSDSGSSEENYECQESSHIDTNFNFDELFLDNTTSTECCPDQIIVPSGDDVDLDSITVVEKTCSVQNSISTSSISDISTIKYISQQSENNHDTGIGLELTTGKLMNNVGKTPLSSTSLLTTKSMSQDICSETNSFGFEQDSSKNSSPKCSIPEVKQEDFYDSKTNNTAANSFLITQQVSEIEDKKEFGFEVDMDKNKANIVSDTTPTSIVHTSTSRLKYSQENLEKKLANLLPSIPVYRSLDTKIPDVAAVSSRDEEINLIRRKYANFSQGSIESNTSEPVNNEVFQGIVSNPALLESFTKTENHENKLDLSLIKVTECSTKSSEDKKSNENKILSLLQNQNTSDSPVLRTVSDREKVLVDSKFRNEIKCIDNTQTCIRPEKPDHLESDNISKESTGKEPQKSTCPQTLIDFEKPKHPESPIESCSLEKYKNKSSSPSPNRRGSEVALSLILKENSKILSKIQHQSRRNSEFSGDATFKEEQKKHENYKNQENNDTLELKLGEEIASLKKIDSNSLCSSTETLLFSQILNKSSNNVDLTNTINQNETRMSSNLFEANVSSPFQQSSEDKVETVTEIDDKHEILLRPRKCKDSLQISTNYLDAHETDEHTTLPDVCKLDGYSNKISKYGADCEVSNVRNVGSTSSELNVLQEDSVAESSPKGFVNKGFIETYRYTLGSGLEPYTIDSTNHNSVLSSQTPSVGERILDTRAIPSEDYEREQIQRSYVFKDYMYSDGITSTKHFTDTFSETNEDILKELQALDIKPEDTVSSFGTNNNPLSPTYSNNSCPYNKKGGKHIAEEASPSDHSFRFVSSKNDSDDNFCEMRTSRKFIQNHFRDNKASSLDTCTSMKDVSTMFLDDKCRSLFVRSATVVEDDDSLYINSYKSHGRLLIEKGELDTFQNSNVNSTIFSEKVSLDEKPKDFVVRSAYELNETSSVSPHSSFSQFLPRDSKFPELSEIEKKDRSNFRSENHKGSVSPSRCRFTSASPVQKRLDPLYIEPSSSNSASSRISASPQQTLKCRESSCYTSFDDYTMSDYSYRDTSDFKKYHYRTESLDFEPKKPDRPSLHQRKRADSYEISTSEKASQDKKTSPPTSPVKFNPFPIRSSARQPKELGIKLGLYLPQKSDKSPSKRLT